MRYPTDSRSLQDGVGVTRAFKRVEQATGVVGGKLRNRMRATMHRVLEIARAARSRAGQGVSGCRKGIHSVIDLAWTT